MTMEPKVIKSRGIKQVALLLVLSFIVATAFAERFPAWYPDKFPRTGVVDGIDVVKRIMIVHDSMYLMSDRMVMHSFNSEFDTPDNLAKGMTIGYRVVGAGTGRPMITEAWVLPASMSR